VLWNAGAAGGVSRLALAPTAFDETRTVARAWFRELGRERFTWWVADSATPSDLCDRLTALGAEPEVELAAMVRDEPPPAADGVTVRPIESLEEHLASRELVWEAFDVPEDVRAAGRAQRVQAWRDYVAMDHQVIFVALLDDTIAAGASVILTPSGGFLLGGNTRPELRGRGAYRALVRARWDEAERRGTPLLGVHAGPMSRPILERLGFRTVSHVHVFADHAS
jgi:GNAT superfamily N-acetyltransferase